MERVRFRGGLSGWEFFEHHQERLIGSGMSTAEYFLDDLEGRDFIAYDAKGFPIREPRKEGQIGTSPVKHFRRRRLMKSWEYFSRWKQDHPGDAVPREINHIRDDKLFEEWARLGFPVYDPTKPDKADGPDRNVNWESAYELEAARKAYERKEAAAPEYRDAEAPAALPRLADR